MRKILSWAKRGKTQARGMLAALMVLMALVAGAGCRAALRPSPSASAPAGKLTLTFLAVGQADAILVRSPEGKAMLIDGGNSPQDAEKVILPYLRTWGIKRLDYVVLTHPHQDHVGGLPRMVRGVPIGAVVLGGEVHANEAYEEFLRLIKDRGIPVVKARPGASLDMGGSVKVEVLSPQEPLFGEGHSPVNNNSVVLRFSLGKVNFLLMGDLEKEGEERLLASGRELGAQVLKVGHHGSKYASGEAFLRAVGPQVAIISVGAGNSFGHPHPETLSRLEGVGARIYRTDLPGTITVTTDGESFSMESKR